MATIKAFVRSSKNNKPINIRFRLSDGRDIQIFHTSEFLVVPDTWDNKEQMIKKRIIFKEADRNRINKNVSDRKALILEVYAQNKDKAIVTSDWLELEIDKAINPQKYIVKPKFNTILEFANQFIKDAPNRKDKVTGRLLSHNNIQQYQATFKHLQSFANKVEKEDFNFEEIDLVFYNRFVAYLQSEITTIDDKGNVMITKKKFTANSVGKHIRILKLMLNEATAQGYNTSTIYNTFHVFTEETDTIYLNEDELEQLKAVNLSDTPYLDRVRDWFLLLAWTGCRFSDLGKVGKTDIKDNFISFRQQKTNTKVTIPLHPIVLEILEKYDYSLPSPISNQRFNEYIKEVAKRAEINNLESVTTTKGGELVVDKFHKWQLVSSHTGRRSFCTNMYKRGLPTLMIMSISGHKTEKSFLKYIKVKQSEHAEMMAKAWKEIYK